MRERSNLIYEDYPGCPNPPIIEVPQELVGFSWGPSMPLMIRYLVISCGKALKPGNSYNFLKQLHSHTGTMLNTINLRRDPED